jgi:hypothetical protein
MRDPRIPEAYVRVWVTGNVTVADGVLFSVGQDQLNEAKIDVQYLGSARLSFEKDVPPEDRCHLLIGFRGRQIAEAVDFVNTRKNVDASRTQVLEVERFIVNRTAPTEPLELFDP